MPRFFVENTGIKDNTITITGMDVNHIKNVLRKKIGDTITVSDQNRVMYETRIHVFEKDKILLEILNKSVENNEAPIDVTLFLSLIKPEKLEWAIQKSVEIGVNTIVPVITERTVIKIHERDADKKRDRWQKIAEAAAKQCGRSLIPTVKMPEKYKNIFKLVDNFDKIVIPYENEKSLHTKDITKELKFMNANRIGLVIGPEGGFTEDEIIMAQRNQCMTLSLGPRILRAETAAIAALSILFYELGDLG